MAEHFFTVEDMAFVELKAYDPEQTSLVEYFPQYRNLGLEMDLQQLFEKTKHDIDSLSQQKVQDIFANMLQIQQLLTASLVGSTLSHNQVQARKIRVSENHLLCSSEQAFAKQQQLAIMLIFSPKLQCFFIKGQVRHCKASADHFDLEIELSHPRETSRRLLAAHVVAVQRHQRLQARSS